GVACGAAGAGGEKRIGVFPEAAFQIAGTVVAFDHLKKTLRVIVNAAVLPGGEGADEAYDRAVGKIKRVLERLEDPGSSGIPRLAPRITEGEDGNVLFGVESNMERERFLEIVARAREYVKAGDIFQVVLSQRFQRRIRADSFSLYRALRATNPSPYMYFLDFGDFTVVGSSPEVMVRLEEGKITLRPIAGTRRRGRTPEEDEGLERELLGDEKERAEHIMLVDLGRNDVGRVAEKGSVVVDELMTIERYSHVMHIVSNVTGRLERGRTACDVIRSAFPAGTVSGAPKIRAMEIISELEPDRRGPYAGAAGYIGFDGNADTAIVLRTILVSDGVAAVQAGAGIVYDSVPEREFEETVNKAAGMLRAIEWAERGL
ncbi:MAG: anthranilate synthase component I, partial [Candidatus Hydrogenedentota bacterium]